MTSETVREALEDAKGLLNTSELSRKLNKTIVNSSDMTWFELLQNVTPIVIASVEKGKIELLEEIDYNNVVTNLEIENNEIENLFGTDLIEMEG